MSSVGLRDSKSQQKPSLCSACRASAGAASGEPASICWERCTICKVLESELQFDGSKSKKNNDS